MSNSEKGVVVGKKTSIDTFKKQLVSDRADGLEKFRFGSDDAQYPIMELGMDCIDVEPQVRIEFQENEIDDLCSSIEKTMEMGVPYGLLQPVLVSIQDPVFKRYKLEAGERRYRAFKKLGRRTIPAIVIGQNASINSYVIQLYENIHRKNLHIIEKAHGVVQYVRVEIAKTERPCEGDLVELIRNVLAKTTFKRELTENEGEVMQILDQLKVPLGTLRNWLWAASFSERIQKYFIENNVPFKIIRDHRRFAQEPDDIVIAELEKAMGRGHEDGDPSEGHETILRQKKLSATKKGLEKLVSTMSKEPSKLEKTMLLEIFALASKLKELIDRHGSASTV